MHQRLLSKRALCLVVISLLLLQAKFACADESPSPEGPPSRDQILSKLRESLGQSHSVDLNALADVNYLVDGENSSEKTTLLIRRQGRKALYSSKTCFHDPSASQPSCRQYDQIVLDNDDVMLCGAALTPSLDRLQGQSDIKVSLLSTRIAGHQDIDRETLWNGMNDAAAVLWIIGYRPLQDYLEDVTQVDVRSGEPIADVVATSVYGELKMALDGTAGWLPKSIEIIKRPNHVIMGKPLSEATEGKADSMTFTLAAADYVSDTEGRWRPRTITVERKTNWKGKKADLWTTKVDVESVKFSPSLEDSDFESSIEIPVGYQIGVVGAGHLPYIWNGHEAVPGIPEKSNLQALNSLTGSRGGRLRLLIIFNTLLVAVLLAAMWWRRRETSAKSQA